MVEAYDRTKYLAAVKTELEPNIYKHSLALEACMGGIYDYLAGKGQLGAGEPVREDWLLAGLIHDIDYAGDFKAEHPKKIREALARHGLEISDEVLHIVEAHAPELTGVEMRSKADWAIFCADSLTGLITAMALILPSKKLAEVKTSSIIKRFYKQPSFAAGTRRDEVAKCADASGLNIPVEEFIGICLVAMQGIAADLEL